MDLSGWEFHELEEEMRSASGVRLLRLFEREDKSLFEKSRMYARHSKKLTSNDRDTLEKECEFHQKSKIKIALRIAESLIK